MRKAKPMYISGLNRQTLILIGIGLLVLVFGAILLQDNKMAKAEAAVQTPAEYELGEKYTLAILRYEYSSVNISQELRVYQLSGEGPIPEAFAVIGAGEIEVYAEQSLDTPTHQAYVVLLNNGGRADPCHIYVPIAEGTAMISCR